MIFRFDIGEEGVEGHGSLLKRFSASSFKGRALRAAAISFAAGSSDLLDNRTPSVLGATFMESAKRELPSRRRARAKAQRVHFRAWGWDVGIRKEPCSWAVWKVWRNSGGKREVVEGEGMGRSIAEELPREGRVCPSSPMFFVRDCYQLRSTEK